ncbi:MAG TPA: tRNA lysidine(34) synthetase TilS [Caulobacteraceae bacterium]|nr:tRNA lysidine(34) synthetase TilS [Caulobacteraceae bacterium]
MPGALLRSQIGLAAFAALDAHLDRRSNAPVVVGFSGGGDSLALLLAVRAWCDANGRAIVAVTIDHQLQPASAIWARWCESRCRRLGVSHLTLAWEGPKPSTGIAAAARGARHRLIAQAARRVGARVVLLGHTADDLREAALMRAAGATTSSPRVWSPSPVWPDGRGVFLLRPLLGASRSTLRLLLAAEAESWIDDPANDDLASLRARVRHERGIEPPPGPPSCTPVAPAALTPSLAFGPAGEVTLDRDVWSSAPAGLGARWLGIAIACASGREAAPRGRQVARLADRLRQTPELAATLGGASVLARRGEILLARESSDGRRPPCALVVEPGDEAVWDGRFLVRARQRATFTHVAGRASALSRPLRARLAQLDPAARRGVPLARFCDGDLALPSLTADPRLLVAPLAAERFAAAAGAFQHESAMVQWRNDHWAPSL